MIDDPVGREWIAALSHELRSPVAAILGYAELVEDGALGEVSPRATDAVGRIGAAAEQLVALLDGLSAAMESGQLSGADGTVAAPPERIRASELIGAALDVLRFEADSRQVELIVEPSEVVLHTSIADAGRAFSLALGAAVKSSPGATLRIAAVEAETPCILVHGSSLDAERDDPVLVNAGERVTGAALRLSLARASAFRAGGDVVLSGDGEGVGLRLLLPRAVG